MVNSVVFLDPGQDSISAARAVQKEVLNMELAAIRRLD